MVLKFYTQRLHLHFQGIQNKLGNSHEHYEDYLPKSEQLAQAYYNSLSSCNYDYPIVLPALNNV